MCYFDIEPMAHSPYSYTYKLLILNILTTMVPCVYCCFVVF